MKTLSWRPRPREPRRRSEEWSRLGARRALRVSGHHVPQGRRRLVEGALQGQAGARKLWARRCRRRALQQPVGEEESAVGEEDEGHGEEGAREAADVVKDAAEDRTRGFADRGRAVEDRGNRGRHGLDGGLVAKAPLVGDAVGRLLHHVRHRRAPGEGGAHATEQEDSDLPCPLLRRAGLRIEVEVHSDLAARVGQGQAELGNDEEQQPEERDGVRPQARHHCRHDGVEHRRGVGGDGHERAGRLGVRDAEGRMEVPRDQRVERAPERRDKDTSRQEQHHVLVPDLPHAHVLRRLPLEQGLLNRRRRGRAAAGNEARERDEDQVADRTGAEGPEEAAEGEEHPPEHRRQSKAQACDGLLQAVDVGEFLRPREGLGEGARDRAVDEGGGDALPSPPEEPRRGG
mmetsp:Transcript_28352/g.82141  ORF Transcript_28352/g.82141 Transcript_28352/m.82141 type:complete len:402 (-) Transcript_28352:344-1549(-)